MTGSEHNDEFYMDKEGRIRTKTNRSGGIQVYILVFWRHVRPSSYDMLLFMI